MSKEKPFKKDEKFGTPILFDEPHVSNFQTLKKFQESQRLVRINGTVEYIPISEAIKRTFPEHLTKDELSISFWLSVIYYYGVKPDNQILEN
jgi:hypothetical protein